MPSPLRDPRKARVPYEAVAPGDPCDSTGGGPLYFFNSLLAYGAMDNIQQLMQLGQQMQAKMTELQKALEARRVSASSGGGMVTVTVDGKGSVKQVQIDPTCVDSRDVEMLEDLVLAAVSEAQVKAQGEYEQELKKITGGLPMNIPGLAKLF